MKPVPWQIVLLRLRMISARTPVERMWEEWR